MSRMKSRPLSCLRLSRQPTSVESRVIKPCLRRAGYRQVRRRIAKRVALCAAVLHGRPHELRSSPASRPPRPASCISAGRAPRCSTGSMRAGAAASSCCASRTPTARARPMRRSRRSSTGCKWLGLDWDGEAVHQFSRAARHREVVEQMLAAGKAYRCYASPEELAADAREGARRGQAPSSMTGAGATAIPSEAPPGVKPAIRLKAPLTGETVIEDQVQGRVVWQNENLDDLVLLRSDGTPTYMLAVVVDDHDMGVTHIIRGDDHLTNGARQTQIYEALGWSVPVMAHIPLIHGPDGAKLSKRHGALGVEAYRAMGYLPVAMRNYLVRLGWAHGDQEIFSTEEMIAAFDLPAIGRSPARFDLRQAGQPQRPLHPPDVGRRPRRRDRARAAVCAGRRRACREDDARAARKAHRRDARPEGARQNAGRADRERALSLCRPAARARREGGRANDSGDAHGARHRGARSRHGRSDGARKPPRPPCAPMRSAPG